MNHTELVRGDMTNTPPQYGQKKSKGRSLKLRCSEVFSWGSTLVDERMVSRTRLTVSCEKLFEILESRSHMV